MAGRGVNKVILVGRLGADPEERRTQTGLMVVKLSLATTDSWFDNESNERRERTEWHRVVMFGKLAEIATQYLRKGSLIFTTGRLQTSKWHDQRTGHDRWSTEIIATEMVMLDSRRDDQPSRQQDSYSSTPRTSAGATPASGPSDKFPSTMDDPIEDVPW